ncbi:MAG: reverse transcriptase-like protein [Candidatus Dormibacteria bacterium]
MKRFVLHTDGGARGNPGPAAIGVVVEAEGEGGLRVVAELGEVIGVASNNVAEYRALIRGLEEARRLGAEDLECLLDSQLVVEQMSGRFKVKHANVVPLHREATDLARAFKKVVYRYVPRAQNAEADRLVNAALDGKPVTSVAEADGPSPGDSVAAPAPGAASRQTLLALGTAAAHDLLTQAFRDAVEIPRLPLERINRELPESERLASEGEAWRARWAVAEALGEFAIQLGVVTRTEVEELQGEFRDLRPG